MISKSEKIAIGIIIFLLIFPSPFLIFFKLIGGGVVGYWIFQSLILDPIYVGTPSFWADGTGTILGVIIGLSMVAILYYEIMSRILKDPNKKRKILIGFIILYIISGNIYVTILMRSASWW